MKNTEVLADKIKHYLKTSKDSVILSLHVVPGSRVTKLVLDEEGLVFYTEEPPIRGRANSSLVKYIAKALRISTSRVSIIRGTKSRDKLVSIEGVDADYVAEKLAEKIVQRK
ncbi:MAG: DUF167 domain-containing protein [Desulfurococcales archaeon]|nr:DUF167 domain-containing protein [Desulfurococcales archaeon]